MYQVRILEGLLNPITHFEKLHQSEKVKGLSLRIATLIGLSLFLAAGSAYLGIHTEEIMKLMDTIGREKLEFAKLLFGIGGLLSGLLSPVFTILFFTLVYRVFFYDIGWIKLFTIGLFPAFLLFIEKVLNFPLFYFLGIDSESSPFGFGVLIQLISEQAFLVNALSHITIFIIWSAWIQIIALKKMSDKMMKSIVGIVIFAYFIYILVTASFVLLTQNLGISL
ncbi:hypothetical protein GJU41_19535 [Bacillus idriensis]|uniref:Yip1 domain-containing protein n=1 Tax=Metabacillus idriensis TaxID=324768 RepID=A0A6I2MFN0_9BACI|nr:hypothetical protein [Metabacillus idriensis]MRX56154.1 hypothetical protein [Metabacillus idriensis]